MLKNKQVSLLEWTPNPAVWPFHQHAFTVEVASEQKKSGVSIYIPGSTSGMGASAVWLKMYRLSEDSLKARVTSCIFSKQCQGKLF